jgi:hypothetical protein
VSYRAPPAVLPSLRDLADLPGTRLMWPPGSPIDDELSRERGARWDAEHAPCPDASPWSYDGPAPRWFFPPPPKDGPRYPPANVPE